MSRLCPRCGAPVRGNGPCPRCGAGKSGYGSSSKRTKQQEAARKRSIPSRARYNSDGYKRSCQLVLKLTGGLCASCGKRIADNVGGKWVFRRGAGGCHHIKPMRSGGTDTSSNLVPLCSRCHNRLDAELRRRDKGA